MYHFENNIIRTDYDTSLEFYEGGVGHFCFDFMKKHQDKIAQIQLSSDETETYKTLLNKCIRTSITLQKMGVEKGDVITFCSNTNLNSCVPIIACLLIGAVPSYVNTTFSVYEITPTIMSLDPKLILVTEEYLENINCIIKGQNRTMKIVIFNEDFFMPQEEEITFTPVHIDDLSKTAIIHFSSGSSSGVPRGVCINHYSLISTKAFSLKNLWVPGKSKVVLTFDSLYWSIESLRLMCAIKEGVCRLVGSGKSDIENAWFSLEKYKVNVGFLIPLTIIDMLESGKPKHLNLSNLTTIYIEGSLLPAKYHEAMQKLLPNVDIFHWYGQTEVGGLTTFRKISLHRKYNREKPGCVGVPIPGFGMSFKVVDLECGETLGRYQRGELFVRGRTVMNGYHNVNNSDVFDDHGWLKTGDVVYYDEDFCFFIVDRLKELIIYQGWHIAPKILEAELLSYPAVKLAVVVGIPDEKNFEQPLGLVVLRDNIDTVSAKDIEKYVEERVSDNYRLRGGIKIIKESFLKRTRKIQRLKLKELVLSGEIA